MLPKTDLGRLKTVSSCAAESNVIAGLQCLKNQLEKNHQGLGAAVLVILSE